MTVAVLHSVDLVETTDLDELAAAIGREHHAVTESLSASLNHAIRTGELLLHAKSLVEFGHWDEWLSDKAIEWNMTIEWARSYMRFARFQDELRAQRIPSAKAARAHLRQRVMPDVRIDPTKRMECDRLKREGWTQAAIAKELGVSQPTVWRWFHPEKELKYRRQRAKTSRAGRAALKKNERSTLAKRVGGDLGEGYALLRQTLDTLERAAAAHTGEARREIRSAMNSLYNAEDSVAKAVKLAVIE